MPAWPVDGFVFPFVDEQILAARYQMYLLYCDTFVGPQLLQGVPGECCSVGTGATNQIGYLCVYGNTTSSGGVCQDMPTISSGCPSNGTVVCCFGSPC